MAAQETPADATAVVVDPLHDPRWLAFIDRHSRASIFHTREWLLALQRAFGYEPLVVTNAHASEELSNGIPFCVVRSRLTGDRVVSLPFSDHCEFLGDHQQGSEELLPQLATLFPTALFHYIELRPPDKDFVLPPDFRVSEHFFLHTLDLAPSIEHLFRSFHRDSVQRRILRGARAGLRCEDGNSERLLRLFFGLHVQTRRRLGLPPSPFKWFGTLAETLKERMRIRVAFAGEKAIAAVITLHFKGTVTYKYSASDARYHRFAAVPLLLWKAIEEAKSQGARELDFGRCDLTGSGLRVFKRHWGTRESALKYWQTGCVTQRSARSQLQRSFTRPLFAHMPRWALIAIGQKLYRHIG
jgi:hypothetical protein